MTLARVKRLALRSTLVAVAALSPAFGMCGLSKECRVVERCYAREGLPALCEPIEVCR